MTKVLFIWYKRSKGILEGGGHVSARNYRVVCQVVGAENVDSYYIHDETRPKSRLSKVVGVFWFPFNYFYGLTPARVRKIAKMAENYDAVFIDRSVFGVIARKLKTSGYKGRVITFFHNVEKTYFDARMSPKLPFRGVVLRCVEANDRMSCKYSDGVMTLSQRDSDVIKMQFGRGADAVATVTLPDALCGKESSDDTLTSTRPLCLFLGTYFLANNNAILWFVDEVLPHVDIRIRIVGRDMARLQQEAPQLKDIDVLSDVPDVKPYLEGADIVVLPIFSGSGMKVKTCESLMYGKNIVGTSEAFAGYDVEYDRVGGMCNTAEEFISCLKEFSRSPRYRFNAYSRQSYLDKYSDAAVIKLFRNMLS